MIATTIYETEPSGLDGLEHLTDADIATDEWTRLRTSWETGGT